MASSGDGAVRPALTAKWGTSWPAIAEEHAASRDLYEVFAHWLTRVYVKRDGKHLETGGALAVWGGVIYQAAQRFKSSSCLERGHEVG